VEIDLSAKRKLRNEEGHDLYLHVTGNDSWR
jgi:hypothetical protein